MYLVAIGIVIRIFKVGLILLVFSMVSTAIAFVVYNIYFGSMITLGYIVSYKTLNLIFFPTFGAIIYVIYTYLND